MTPQRKRAVEIVTARCRGHYDAIDVMEAAYAGWERAIVAEGLLERVVGDLERSGFKREKGIAARIRSFLSAEGE